MTFKQFAGNLANPSAIAGLLGAAISVAVAFGAPLTEAQTHAVLVFGGSISLVLFAHGITNALSYLTPQTVTGLVTAIIGVAIAFGANVTEAQTTQILNLTAVLAGLLLVHGAVHTAARDRRQPQAAAPVTEHTVILRPDASELQKLLEAVQACLASVTAGSAASSVEAPAATAEGGPSA